MAIEAEVVEAVLEATDLRSYQAFGMSEDGIWCLAVITIFLGQNVCNNLIWILLELQKQTIFRSTISSRLFLVWSKPTKHS